MLDEKIIFNQQLFTWLNVGKLNIEISFLGDNLSIFMSMFVTFVGWLIHIYAIDTWLENHRVQGA
jgi:NADH-quinone oxidoreductase subunit L